MPAETRFTPKPGSSDFTRSKAWPGVSHSGWESPAGESTTWPQGVSVQNGPDMSTAGCDAATEGCQTFDDTNQQSARLLFYHDHSWGITRLNVYAGEAAGYLITDATEQQLFGLGERLPDFSPQ